MIETADSASSRPTSLPRWVWLFLGSVAYYLSAKAGMALFSLQPSNITLLWFPLGIGMVMALHHGPRALPFVFVATLASNLPGMAHEVVVRWALHATVSAAADTAAAAAAAWLLRRFLVDGLQRPSDLFRFAILVCLPATLICAVVLTVNLVLGGYIHRATATDFVAMLLFADSLGLLLVYPLYEAWLRRRRGVPVRWRSGLALTLLAALLTVLAFQGTPGLIFLVGPTLIYVLFRSREHHALLSLSAIVTLMVALASRDFGPFSAANPADNHFMLLTFLVSTTVVVLALMLQERRLGLADAERESWRFHAHHDALTGLPNRASLLMAMQRELELSRQAEKPLHVALLDIDHFKQVNDQLGHSAGDQVLRALAELLQAQVRDVDGIGRYGGEEFVVILPGLEADAALRVLERLRDTVARTPIMLPDRSIVITISGGLIAADPLRHRTPGDLLADADRRLYEAKRSGRNRIVAD